MKSCQQNDKKWKKRVEIDKRAGSESLEFSNEQFLFTQAHRRAKIDRKSGNKLSQLLGSRFDRKRRERFCGEKKSIEDFPKTGGVRLKVDGEQGRQFAR